MYYKLRCNSTQFVIYYRLRNYYKLQRNMAFIFPVEYDTTGMGYWLIRLRLGLKLFIHNYVQIDK